MVDEGALLEEEPMTTAQTPDYVSHEVHEAHKVYETHEAKYPVSELIAAYKTMGFPKECVMASLRSNKIQTATYHETVEMVENFMRQVVE